MEAISHGADVGIGASAEADGERGVDGAVLKQTSDSGRVIRAGELVGGYRADEVGELSTEIKAPGFVGSQGLDEIIRRRGIECVAQLAGQEVADGYGNGVGSTGLAIGVRRGGAELASAK